KARYSARLTFLRAQSGRFPSWRSAQNIDLRQPRKFPKQPRQTRCFRHLSPNHISKSTGTLPPEETMSYLRLVSVCHRLRIWLIPAHRYSERTDCWSRSSRTRGDSQDRRPSKINETRQQVLVCQADFNIVRHLDVR